jgi:hypothetical protein
MTFNINNFKQSAFQKDFYRANLFEVTMSVIPAPMAVVADSDFKFLCKTAQLPGETITENLVPYMNREIKIPGDMETPGAMELTVLNNQDMKLRIAFGAWINAMQNRNTGKSLFGNLTGALTANFTITPFNRNGKKIDGAEVILQDAFPTAVGAIDLAWAAGSEPSEFPLTVAYTFWTGLGSI